MPRKNLSCRIPQVTPIPQFVTSFSRVSLSVEGGITILLVQIKFSPVGGVQRIIWMYLPPPSVCPDLVSYLECAWALEVSFSYGRFF